jgi:hypothetical protein
MKDYRKMGTDSYFLDLDASFEVSGQLHAPTALLPGKDPLVLIGYEVWCAPDPVWTTWRSEDF